jgi:hypothetical protein
MSARRRRPAAQRGYGVREWMGGGGDVMVVVGVGGWVGGESDNVRVTTARACVPYVRVQADVRVQGTGAPEVLHVDGPAHVPCPAARAREHVVHFQPSRVGGACIWPAGCMGRCARRGDAGPCAASLRSPLTHCADPPDRAASVRVVEENPPRAKCPCGILLH